MNVNKKKVEKTPPVVQEKAVEKKPICFYPDIDFNKRERRRALVLSAVLLFFLGGMGISVFVAGIKDNANPMGWISGVLMMILFVLAISMIPGAFKQYPVKHEPIIEITPKEIKVFGETYKLSDILEARLTITLESVGNKAENEKFLDSILDKEPQAGLTANLDFAVPDTKRGKTKTVYTTVENAYEALVALYQVGFKRYSIVYSLKKLAKKATFSIGERKTEDGKTLASLSKKDRLKQLF